MISLTKKRRKKRKIDYKRYKKEKKEHKLSTIGEEIQKKVARYIVEEKNPKRKLIKFLLSFEIELKEESYRNKRKHYKRFRKR